ncbi:hypothetical protein LTR36_002654 [Oleoguttula mirabilis]|uniref:FAD-binding domain-containing protein n=1 Tax=Oleoguttula mirabilis TaxID=1507867 RepID=A0AAV9JJU1_9PEZI|nr:hypothetical protein LTR36_002654 [Oleoguttula mirabilis]
MESSSSPAEQPLKVLVIGAGLGGCAAALALHHQGFDVTVYERLRHFKRLGDSLGLGENALKLLRRWGGQPLYDTLTRIGNQAPEMQIRRWHDGKVLARQPLMDMAGYIGHRGDYHEVFLQAVRETGVPILMGHEVVGFDEDRPSIVLADGSEITADVVVGADGIKSRARELVLGFKDHPRSSGYSCFRAYFPGEIVKGDAKCREFVEGDCVNIWIGEDTHVVQNTLRGGEEFNWILTRKISHEKDLEITESWSQEGDLEEVWRCIEGLDERIGAAIRKTPRCLDWKICYRDPLPTWTRTYEKLRFARTRQSQTNGEDLRDRWHNALKDVNEGIEIDPESVMMRNRPLYAFDAEADAMQRWHEVSSRVAEELRTGHVTPLFNVSVGKGSGGKAVGVVEAVGQSTVA